VISRNSFPQPLNTVTVNEGQIAFGQLGANRETFAPPKKLDFQGDRIREELSAEVDGGSKLTDRETGFTLRGVKTISIRDLRQKWPAVERGLKASGGLLITRDSKPVARLMPLESPDAAVRERFDPAAQAAWLKKTWGRSLAQPWVDAALGNDRGDG